MPDPITLSVTVDARSTQAGVRQVEVDIDRLGRAQVRMAATTSQAYKQMAQAINQTFDTNRAAFTRMIQHQEREMKAFRDRRIQLGKDTAAAILRIEQKLQEDIALVNQRSSRRLQQLSQRRTDELSRASTRLNPQGAYVDPSGRLRYAGGGFAPASAAQDIQRETAARAAITQRYNNLEVAQMQRTADRVYDLRRAAQARTEKLEQDGLKRLGSIQKGEEAATARHRNQIATSVENSVRSTTAKVQQLAQQTAFSFESIFGANFFGNLAANAIQNLVSRLTAGLRASITYAARTEELGIAMSSMAKAADISSASIQAQADIVSRLNITTQETRTVLTRMIQAQLDVTKATDLAIAAQDLAVVTGAATAETFERLILGITTMQPRLLRTAGVYTTLTELMRDNRKETGQSAISLSSYQKQQLLLNEVLDQAARDVGNYDAAMNTAGKQMRTSIRVVDDLKNAFGQQFLPTLFVIVRAFNQLGDAFGKNMGAFDLVLGLLTVSFISFAASAVRTIPLLKSLAQAFIGLFTPVVTLTQFGAKAAANNIAQTGSVRALAVAELELLGIKKTATVQSAIDQINQQKENTLLQVEAALTARLITAKEAETLTRLALTDAKRAETAASLTLVNAQRGLGATAVGATAGISLLVAAVVTLGVYLSSTSNEVKNFNEYTADQAAEGIRMLNVLALQNKDLAQAQKLLTEHGTALEENIDAYRKVKATLDLVNAADRSRIITQNALRTNIELVNQAVQKQIDLNNQQIELKQKLIALTLQERTATIDNAGAKARQADEDLRILQGLKDRLEKSGRVGRVAGGTSYANLTSNLDLTDREMEAVKRNTSFTIRVFGDLSSVIDEATRKLGEHGQAAEKARADIELFSEQIAKNIVQVRKNQQLMGENVEVYGTSREALAKVKQTNEFVIDTVDKYILKLEQASNAMNTAEKAAEDLSDALAKIKAPDIDLTKTAIAFAELQNQIVERRRLLFEAIQKNVIPRQLGAVDIENVLGIGAKDFISAQEKFYNAFKGAKGINISIEEFRKQLEDANSEATKFVKQQIAIADTQFAKDLAESGASIENWSEEARRAVIESAKLAAQAKEDNLFTTTEKQARRAGQEITNLKKEITGLQVELSQLLAGDDTGENLERQKRQLEQQKNLVRSIFDSASELNIKLGALPNDAEVLRKMEFRLSLLEDIRDARRELNLVELSGAEFEKLTVENAFLEEQRLEAVRDVRTEIRDVLDAQFQAENRLLVLKVTQSIPAVNSEVRAQTRYLELLKQRQEDEREVTANLALEFRLRSDVERDFVAESEKSITKAIASRLQQTREANEQLRQEFASAILITNEAAFDFLPSVQQALRQAVNLPETKNPVLSEIKTTNKLLETGIITKLDQLIQGNAGKAATDSDQYLSPQTRARIDRLLAETAPGKATSFVDFVKQLSEIAGFQTPLPPPGLQGLNFTNSLSAVYAPGRGTDPVINRQNLEFLRSQGLDPAAFKTEDEFIKVASQELAKLNNQRRASIEAQKLLGTPVFALQARANALFGGAPSLEQGEAVSDLLKRLNIRENAVEAARQELETDKEIVKILDLQTRETNRLAENRKQIDRQTAVRITLDLEDENIKREIFRLTEEGLRTEEGLLAKTELLKRARNDRDQQELNNLRELAVLREDEANDYTHSVDFQRRALQGAEIDRLRTAEEVSRRIIETEYNYVHFSEGAADRYKLAWLEAYLAVKQANEDAVIRQIQAQVRLDDALTIHTERIRADIYQVMAEQATLSEAIGQGLADIYTQGIERINQGIDRMTQKMGVFGNLIGGIFKSITAQLINRTVRPLIDAILGPVPNSPQVSESGGLLDSVLRTVGIKGTAPIAGFNSQTVNTQDMVVSASHVVVVGSGGGIIPGASAPGLPQFIQNILGIGNSIRTGGGAPSTANVGSFDLMNLFSFIPGLGSTPSFPATTGGIAGGNPAGRAGGIINGSVSRSAPGFLSSIGAGLGSMAPLLGLTLGAGLGGGSGLGTILGGIGGGLAGLGILGGLSAATLGGIGGTFGAGIAGTLGGLFGTTSSVGGLFAGLFGGAGSLASFAAIAGPIGLIAAPLLVGAMLLSRNAARRRDEKTRDASMVESLNALNDLLSQVKQDKIDGSEALGQAAQIRAAYMQMAQGLKDKKTRNIAIKDVYRLDLIIDRIKAEGAIQTQRKDFISKFVPTYAGGTSFVFGNNASAVIKARPGEGLVFPGGSRSTVPGRDRGFDSTYMSVPTGTRVIPVQQMQAARGYAGGGIVTPTGPAGVSNRPIVVVVVADEKAAAEIGKQIPDTVYAGKLRTHIKKTRGSGIVGDITSEQRGY